MRATWKESAYGEWWADDIGVVIDVQGLLWFGYRAGDNRRIGPFRSRLEAQRALEQGDDQQADDDDTTQRVVPCW